MTAITKPHSIKIPDSIVHFLIRLGLDIPHSHEHTDIDVDQHKTKLKDHSKQYLNTTYHEPERVRSFYRMV